MTHVLTGTILDRILAQSIADLELRRAARPIVELEALADQRPRAINLYSSLRKPGISIIAEIKRASPSRGVFPVEVEPSVVAADYIRGGASAISVLTDEPFFHGSLEDMAAAAETAHSAGRPVAILRKDFIVDAYQIVEARAFGADAVLLIAAALDDRQLTDLFGLARRLGMDALVEVHDEREMARAAAIGARVVGINNRDLRSFSVDLATTERLAPHAPKNAVVVAESGILGSEEVRRMVLAGADAILVGEGVITAPDRAAAVRALWTSMAG